MAEAIVKFYQLNQEEVIKESHNIAKNYLDEVVAQKWLELIER